MFYYQFSCKEPGCTDANAINYDSEANEDDNSCLYNGNFNIEFRLVNGNKFLASGDTIFAKIIVFVLKMLNSICVI